MKTARVCRYPDCDCGIQGCGLPAPKPAPEPAPFAEQFMEALGAHIDARISYAETRRGPNAEYASSYEVENTSLRLEGLLGKIRISL